MATYTTNVHADELEYTKTGLRTPTPLALKVGHHNSVVVTRPKRVKALPLGLAGFGFDSAFPTPPALALFLALGLAGMRAQAFKSSNTFQLFGHAQLEGKDGRNKPLSERRAKVMAAILTGDVDGTQAVADEEGWGLIERQVMLRVLGCDPGPIDGEEGDLTTAAVLQFQAKYADGEFHKDTAIHPVEVPLDVDGSLGARTAAALIDALTTTCGHGITPKQLLPSHATVGCSEFNQIPGHEEHSASSRRVSLVVHPTLPPFHENAPCVEGDHTACPADDKAPQRCLWYRWHVEDPHRSQVQHQHFRPNWLKLPNGKFLLSTLTTVPDEDDVEFQVMTSSHPYDGEKLPKGFFQELLGDTVTCKPRMGVAQVVWDPPANFAPGLDGRVEAAGGAVVPVFKVTHQGSGAIIHDSFPANDIVVLFQRPKDVAEHARSSSTTLELRASNGSVTKAYVSDANVFDDRHHALRFEGVEESETYSLVLSRGPGHEHFLFRGIGFTELEKVELARLDPAPAEQAHELDQSDQPASQDGEDVELDDDAFFGWSVG